MFNYIPDNSYLSGLALTCYNQIELGVALCGMPGTIPQHTLSHQISGGKYLPGRGGRGKKTPAKQCCNTVKQSD